MRCGKEVSSFHHPLRMALSFFFSFFFHQSVLLDQRGRCGENTSDHHMAKKMRYRIFFSEVSQPSPADVKKRGSQPSAGCLRGCQMCAPHEPVHLAHVDHLQLRRVPQLPILSCHLSASHRSTSTPESRTVSALHPTESDSNRTRIGITESLRVESFSDPTPTPPPSGMVTVADLIVCLPQLQLLLPAHQPEKATWAPRIQARQNWPPTGAEVWKAPPLSIHNYSHSHSV